MKTTKLPPNTNLMSTIEGYSKSGHYPNHRYVAERHSKAGTQYIRWFVFDNSGKMVYKDKISFSGKNISKADMVWKQLKDDLSDLKVKGEASTTGGVAPSGHSGLTITSDLDPRQTEKRNKDKKKLRVHKLKDVQPHGFKELRENNMDVIQEKQLRKTIRDQIINHVIYEGMEQEEYEGQMEEEKKKMVIEKINSIFANYCVKLNLHTNYMKVFLGDGLKFKNEILDDSIERIKQEIQYTQELLEDIDDLLDKVLSLNANKELEN